MWWSKIIPSKLGSQARTFQLPLMSIGPQMRAFKSLVKNLYQFRRCQALSENTQRQVSRIQSLAHYLILTMQREVTVWYQICSKVQMRIQNLIWFKREATALCLSSTIQNTADPLLCSTPLKFLSLTHNNTISIYTWDQIVLFLNLEHKAASLSSHSTTVESHRWVMCSQMVSPPQQRWRISSWTSTSSPNFSNTRDKMFEIVILEIMKLS